MSETERRGKQAVEQVVAVREVDRFRLALGPFVAATEATRMAMTFTNAAEPGNPIIFANDSFLTLTGFESKEVIGQSFTFLMSRVADATSVARIVEQFEARETETVEVECRRHNRTAVLLAIRINAVHDRHGKVVQHCVSFVNLSDHIERVRQERDALHALYQHTPDFIATTQGADHEFTFANDAFQRLVGNRGTVGRTIAEAMPELTSQGFIDRLDQVFATGEPFAGKSTAVDLRRGAGRKGEIRFIDFICQAVRGAKGEITGIFCEGHDVTDEKLATEQLQKLQADVIHLARVSAMGTTAAALAHELAQPLTAISNYVEVCRHLAAIDKSGGAQFAENLEGVRENSQRAREIIRRLKGMTKRIKPERELFDLKSAVGETIKLLRIGGCAGVSLHDRSRSGVMLNGDRVQIQQVMTNLLRNGCEAAAGGADGRVTISTLAKENRAIVSVRDNGPGLSAQTAASLFDWSESAKPDGMGIGLSICRTIIDAHGGNIWLESSDSEGTCFRFSLPILPE
jgi:two-component system sensor kinase FixL